MTTLPNPRPASAGALLGVAILLLCSIGSANAFQLGELKVNATLGEALDGQVDVYLNPSDRNADIRFSITPDITYLSNTELTAFVRSMNAEFVTPNFGRPHIRLTSAQPINNAIVAFRLKVTINDVGHSRNYSLIPGRPPAAPDIIESTARSPSPARSQPTVDVLTQLTASTYGPVRRGDTLWAIAKQVAPKGSKNVGALVQAIFDANPTAFINGDQNLLKQGVVLQIPGSAPMVVAETQEPAMPAEPIVDQPTTETSAVRVDEIETPEQTLSEAEVLTALDDSDVGAVVDKPIARKPVSWQSRDPALALELDRLGKKYAALKARYASQQAAGGETAQAHSADTPIVADTVVPPVEVAAATPSEFEAPPTESITADTLQPRSESRNVDNAAPAEREADNKNTLTETDSVVDAASANTSGERVVSNVTSGAALNDLLSWVAVALAIMLVIVVGALLIKLRGTQQKRTALEQHNELERERKAEVTKKAQQRLTMEGEVERMLKSRTPTSLEEQTIAVHVDDIDIGEDEKTDDAVDGQSQIDMSIAHGRYEEAQKLLLDVIESSPRNFSAKLRLAEVFYITERIDDFVDIANDLHQHHRSDITDEDWRRIMRMGKMIAPERPPFSGPRSISDAESS